MARGGVTPFLQRRVGTSTRGGLTGFWPRGFVEGFTGVVALSFFTSWSSAFPLSFVDGFFKGTEEEPSLEIAEDAVLDHLRASFSVLANEVPTWLDETGGEHSQSLRFFEDSGSVRVIVVAFNR